MCLIHLLILSYNKLSLYSFLQDRLIHFLSAQDTITGAAFHKRCELKQITNSGQILTNSESNYDASTG